MTKKAKINRLYWDIETSPNVGLFWQSGYKVNISHDSIVQERAIMCICYKWEHQKTVHSLEWDNGDDKKMIEEFIDILSIADETVAHNGDNFDIKFFNSRVIYHNLVPQRPCNSVDTLKLARKKFRFNSNRLDYLGKYLFEDGKIHTSFDLWKDILLKNCEKAMRKMVKYCKKDVLLLEKVYQKLCNYDEHKTHVGMLNGYDGWSCPECASIDVIRDGIRVMKASKKYRMRCKCCGRVYQISQANINKFYEYRKFEKPENRRTKS
jgi:DNA polymerase elongation subunit (family B)